VTVWFAYAAAGPAVAQPSSITWGPAQSITGDSDVVVTGALIYAYSFTASGSPATGPVNGVAFQPFGIPFDSQTVTVGDVTISEPDPRRLYSDVFTTGSAPFSTLSPDYRSLLGSYVIANDPLQITLQLGGLTPGTAYDFQWWTNTKFGSNRTTAKDVTSTGTITLQSQVSPSAEGQLGQYAVGRFTASGTSYSLLFSGATGSDLPIINGFQLRTSPLIWNTTAGTWNTTNTVWTSSAGGTLAFGDGDAVTFSGTGGGTVTMSGSIQPSSISVSATSGTYSFVSSAGNLITGTTGLTKSGAGTLVLSGGNGFTGVTSVAGGKLLVNGVLASSTTTVATAAVLGGSGTISGAVVVGASGTLSPGGSPGILTVGSLSLSGSAFTLMEIVGSGSTAGVAGIAYDQVAVTGTSGLAFGGTLDLDLGNRTSLFGQGATFQLFSFSGTTSGDFTTIRTIDSAGSYAGLTFSPSPFVAGEWTTGIIAGTGNQYLMFSENTGRLVALPEPSAMALAALGAGLGGWQMWRASRRRQGPRPGEAIQ